MPKPGRLLMLLLLITGFVVAGLKLRVQEVPFFDVAVTGIGFIAALVLLFAVLLGFGKLLGIIASKRNS